MFLFPNLKKYEKAKSLPEVEVTEEEFIKLMVKSGETEDKAKFHATMSKGLGLAVMIGEQKVKIKD
jgi:hypothetical protein